MRALSSLFQILIRKAAPRGGKYYKRVATGKPGRPWQYFYTRGEYEKAHGSGKDMEHGHHEGPLAFGDAPDHARLIEFRPTGSAPLAAYGARDPRAARWELEKKHPGITKKIGVAAVIHTNPAAIYVGRRDEVPEAWRSRDFFTPEEQESIKEQGYLTNTKYFNQDHHTDHGETSYHTYPNIHRLALDYRKHNPRQHALNVAEQTRISKEARAAYKAKWKAEQKERAAASKPLSPKDTGVSNAYGKGGERHNPKVHEVVKKNRKTPKKADAAPAAPGDSLKALADNFRMRSHEGAAFKGNASFNKEEAEKHHAALTEAVNHVAEGDKPAIKKIAASMKLRAHGSSGASFSPGEAKEHHDALMSVMKNMGAGEKAADAAKSIIENGNKGGSYEPVKYAAGIKSKKERLAKVYRKLGKTGAASSHDEAVKQVSDALKDIEDHHSGVPEKPENWQTDGRMYPAQPDRIKKHSSRSDVTIHESKGHESHIGDNGAIHIKDKSGKLEFRKKGKDGKHVY